MWHRYRLLLGGVVVVLMSATISYAVAAAVPMQPLGTTRYAMAQGTIEAADDNSDSGFEDMPNMAASIKIPSGKKGDVMVIFCGEMSANNPTYAEFRAMAGAVQLAAAPVYIDIGTSQNNNCATFYKLNLGAGTRTVRMQWQASFAASVWDRSMIVIVNIHS